MPKTSKSPKPTKPEPTKPEPTKPGPTKPAPTKTTRSGDVLEDELPSTLQHSDPKAQHTYAQTHDAALQTYAGDERAANQVAFAALKHTHEKVGDHWEPKEEYDASDAQAEGDRTTNRPTAGGVDANASKPHLYELATRLEVTGRSRMTKAELVEALQKANDRASAKTRHQDAAS